MTDKIDKKIKIYNLAKELNISSDTIIDFLSKKGTIAKNYLTAVEPNLVDELYSHFKKERHSAELHTKKIAHIEELKKKEVAAHVEHIAKSTVSSTTPLEKARAKRQIVKQNPAAKEVKATGSIVETTSSKSSEIISEADSKVVEPEIKIIKTTGGYVSAKDTASRGSKINLIIKGKLDLKPAITTSTQKKSDSISDINKAKKKKKIIRTQSFGTETAAKPETSFASKTKSRLSPLATKNVGKEIKETISGNNLFAPSFRASIRKNKRKKREIEVEKQIEEESQKELVLRVTEYLTVGSLASLMNKPVGEVIAKCMNLGLMVSINQRIEKDKIILVASDFGFEVEFVTEFVDDALIDVADPIETLIHRSPIVTVMGHVDHGKTSLLDYIRKASVAKGESGGITQHIGAYQVAIPNKGKITFLDTPGHEAFTAMRARGAELTDIVVLVVAAEDSVMPQTIEAISHAKAASVPIIIAINKIDKPEANPERIKQQLADRDVLVEEWGGKYQSVELSARTGKNIDVLLEKIILEAEVLELKANPNRNARCVVVEAKLDKGKGILATVLVQKGTLKIGDSFVAGIFSGKIKAIIDDEGNLQNVAEPSSPIQVLGFDGMPTAGDSLVVVENDKVARDISTRRQQIKREQDFMQIQFVTLEDIAKQIKAGQTVRDLSIIVKGDVDGSVEALADSLMKLSTDEVKILVVHKGVGGISESDVLLASTSNAIIIGFHARPNLNARKLADKHNIDIRYHTIIYNAIAEIKSALEGLLAPTVSEEVTSSIIVRDLFKVPKIGTIAGCYVNDGTIIRNNKVRLIRDGINIFEGQILSLRRFKDDVREVAQGYECGIGLDGYNDLKVGDVIESYQIVETKRKLF